MNDHKYKNVEQMVIPIDRVLKSKDSAGKTQVKQA